MEKNRRIMELQNKIGGRRKYVDEKNTTRRTRMRKRRRSKRNEEQELEN